MMIGHGFRGSGCLHGAFGGVLNDAGERLAYYRRVIQDALPTQTVPCEWSCEFLPMPRYCR